MADGSLIFDTLIDTKGFKKGTTTIVSMSNGLKKTMSKLGTIIGAAFSVKAVLNFSKTCEQEYKNLAQNESRLAQVMRNTMQATNEQIESMIALTDAEEKLGVVQGDVQLAGAQELATYASMPSTLKKLIPVMNDMIAQQYGFEASAESAINIATMMGKVLDGQVGGLSRYGYSFTEAQENILRFGDEEERAATLADVVSQSVGNMNKALGATDTGRQMQLANTMGEINEQFGKAITQIKVIFLPVLQRAASVLATVAGYARQLAQYLYTAFNGGVAESSKLENTTNQTLENQEALTEEVKATTKAAKKAEASFDEINKLTNNSTTGEEADSTATVTPIGGFETGLGIDAEIDTSKLEKALDRVRKYFTDFKDRVFPQFEKSFVNINTKLQPLTEKFKNTFANMFSGLSGAAGSIASIFDSSIIPTITSRFESISLIGIGLSDSIFTVANDIWTRAFGPMLTTLIEEGIPLFAEYSQQMDGLATTLFDEIKLTFDMFWADVSPILDTIRTVWDDLILSIKTAWEKWGQPVFDGFKKVVENVGNKLRTVWETLLKPVWDTFMATVDRLWKEHLKPFFDEFFDFIGELIYSATEIYNEFISPIVDWFMETLYPPISKVISWLVTIIGNFIGGCIDNAKIMIKALKGLLSFITGVFTGDWEKAWEGIKTFFINLWEAIKNGLKTPINFIIDMLNGLIGGLETVLNWVIKGMNKISFDVPQWVADLLGMEGTKFGFNIAPVSFSRIPKLATGTVVPANYGEFMAILGDNKRETEVVSPLSTIKQALVEALQMTGGGKGSIVVNLLLDGEKIAQSFIEYHNGIVKQSGESPLLV